MNPIIIASFITGTCTLLATFLGTYTRQDKINILKDEVTFLKKVIYPKYPEVEITFPMPGEELPKDQFKTIKGKINGSIPPNVKLCVLHKYKEGFYPQGMVSSFNFTDGKKIWESENYFNRDTEIVVVISGNGGIAIFDYYQKVANETEKWIPISPRGLPKDVQIATSVFVKVK